MFSNSDCLPDTGDTIVQNTRYIVLSEDVDHVMDKLFSDDTFRETSGTDVSAVNTTLM